MIVNSQFSIVLQRVDCDTLKLAATSVHTYNTGVALTHTTTARDKMTQCAEAYLKSGYFCASNFSRLTVNVIWRFLKFYVWFSVDTCAFIMNITITLVLACY